jgi:hypothetical protein
VYVFEFDPGPDAAAALAITSPAEAVSHSSFVERSMDSIETFVSQFVLSALAKGFPNLSTDDQAKVAKAVQDFVSTAMDLAAVYLALRASKSTAAATAASAASAATAAK